MTIPVVLVDIKKAIIAINKANVMLFIVFRQRRVTLRLFFLRSVSFSQDFICIILV